jgi:hypothetical protein
MVARRRAAILSDTTVGGVLMGDHHHRLLAKFVDFVWNSKLAETVTDLPAHNPIHA